MSKLCTAMFLLFMPTLSATLLWMSMPPIICITLKVCFLKMSPWFSTSSKLDLFWLPLKKFNFYTHLSIDFFEGVGEVEWALAHRKRLEQKYGMKWWTIWGTCLKHCNCWEPERGSLLDELVMHLDEASMKQHRRKKKKAQIQCCVIVFLLSMFFRIAFAFVKEIAGTPLGEWGQWSAPLPSRWPYS